MKNPQIISFNFEDKSINHTSHPMWGIQKNNQIQGRVKFGKFILNPGDGWKITVPTTGVYVLEHPFTHASYSTVFSILPPHDGCIKVLEAGPETMSIETRDINNELANLDFNFSISLTATAV